MAANDPHQPDLSRLKARRSGRLNPRLVSELIQLKQGVSSIELSLTAITASAVLLRLLSVELSAQIGDLLSGRAAREVVDASIAVTFITIAVAALQIPKHFTDALIHSNREAIRLVATLGATRRFVVSAFLRVVMAALLRALAKGLAAAAIFYLAVAELLQLWSVDAHTGILAELVETSVLFLAFFVVVGVTVTRKVGAIYARSAF